MDIDFGQILPNPTDALYDSTRTYSSMQSCLDEYNSEWLSLVDNNRGHALPGYNEDGSAKVSDYWRCIVNVYRTEAAAKNADEKAALAAEKASLANDKANLANQKANLANEKATYAQNQGDYAKNMADHPSYVGSDGYWYHWDYATQLFVKGPKAKGEDLDYSSMTESEKEELTKAVAEEVANQGGYAIVPVEESTLTTTSVFQKNSVICINGVIYIAKTETQNLPFRMVVEDNKFVTQQMYGKTCFIVASNALSADWKVWLDASNDVRYKMLEDRVARLETIINSL